MFFSKKQDKPQAPAAPVPQPEAKPSQPPQPPNKETKKEFKIMDYEVIIGPNSSINGNICINGCTRIDGRIEGTLAVDNDLYIGEAGKIRATVYAQNATISGEISGNITCKDRLELTSTAKVFGDIKCTILVIAEGAIFRGKSAGFENEEAAEEE